MDVASVELFADNGEIVITDIFFPDDVYNKINLFANEGSINLKSGKITNLFSIWQNGGTEVKK